MKISKCVILFLIVTTFTPFAKDFLPKNPAILSVNFLETSETTP